MAGASDPLEDMLFNEVDEKAVSDLVGSLESQLGNQKTPAASYPESKGEGPSGAAKPFSGKVRDQVGSLEQPQQQGHPKAGLNQEPSANDEALPGKILASTTSSVATGSVINVGSNLQTLGASPAVSHAPGAVTLATPSAAASFNRATALGSAGTSVVTAPNPNIIITTTTTTAAAAVGLRAPSPGLQSLNGGSTAGVKLVNAPPAIAPAAGANSVISTVSAAGSSNIIVSMSSQPNFTVPQSSVASPAITLPRHPSPLSGVSQNGVDPKGSPLIITQGAAAAAASSTVTTTSQVMNHNNNPLMHTKMLVPNQPVSGNSVILGSTPPSAANAPLSQTLTSTTVTLAAGMKPAVNGVGQPAVTIVRHPTAPVMAPTSIQQQRPGLVANTARTAAAPQLAVRPQQQTTIQLPPGFTIPPGRKDQLDQYSYWQCSNICHPNVCSLIKMSLAMANYVLKHHYP